MSGIYNIREDNSGELPPIYLFNSSSNGRFYYKCACLILAIASVSIMTYSISSLKHKKIESGIFELAASVIGLAVLNFSIYQWVKVIREENVERQRLLFQERRTGSLNAEI